MRGTLCCRIVAAFLCLLAIVGCTACGVDDSYNDAYCEDFLKCAMGNDPDSAYELVKHTVTEADFRAYWTDVQTVVEGAQTYEAERTGWNVHYSNGLTTATSSYEVRFDNGRTAFFRVVTRDDIQGIAGIHFSDITEFLQKTETALPIVGAVLRAISLVSIAFTVWMFVDCLRRKMRYKALWAILIFFGTTVTVTVGQGFNLHFDVGLILRTATATADPMLLAVVAKVTVPLGAILYLCLRKRFMISPDEEGNQADADSARD